MELADMIQQIIVDQELVDIQPLELAVEVLADGGGDHACPAGGYTSGMEKIVYKLEIMEWDLLEDMVQLDLVVAIIVKVLQEVMD